MRTVQVEIMLQCFINDHANPCVAAGTYCQDDGKLMGRTEFTWGRRLRPATLLILALLVPLDPDHLFREGKLSMAKDASAAGTQKPAGDSMMPPARDPEIAVAEEYQAARSGGTREALELFIARHPDSALAEKARAELRRLSR